MTPADAQVIWTDYLRHRAHTRGFDLALIEQLLRFASERYFDTMTRRRVVIGRHGTRLVMVPYDQGQGRITPITIHVTTRQQITFPLRTREVRPMKTPKLVYFDQEDILHLLLADGEEANSVELSPTITAGLNAQGEVIGIEVLQASTFVREALLEMAHAQQLKLGPAGK